jgi:hypothetical protein
VISQEEAVSGKTANIPKTSVILEKSPHSGGDLEGAK